SCKRYTDDDKSMNTLQHEIQNMNSEVELVTVSRWLTQKNVRQTKTNSSIVIAVKTQEQAKKLVNRGVWVDSEKKTATHFVKSRPYDRCARCQGFGHSATRCTAKLACRICAEEHDIKGYFCWVCNKTERAYTHV